MATLFTDRRFAPSPVFFGLLGATVAIGFALWHGNDLGGLGVFLFVLAGWVVSLSLHEFGHAIVAFVAGDRSVADKGYLTLDVRRYADPGTSLLFPILILLIGGIGLPGGAVWINQGAIRSPLMRSVVSAAGPAANLLCAIICLIPLRAGWIDVQAHVEFAAALGFLGWMQIIALVLNLLPLPPLDGFGIIEPHLSPQTRRSLQPLRQYGFIILIAALWFVEPVRDTFWSTTDSLSEFIGGDLIAPLRSRGWFDFRFWEN